MRNIPVRLIAFCFVSSLILTSCITGKKAGGKKYAASIVNPSAVERADELVILTREIIEEKIGKIAPGKFIGITAANEPVVVQFDDLNRDGSWDEAVFLQTFAPGETVQLSLSKNTSAPVNAVQRAHVRMRKKNADNTFGPLLDSVTVPGNTPPTDFSKQKLPPYLTEGPAWENDKVAFRVYMDTRNTKDIYGKRTPKMMMDTVGVIPENSYHKLSDWGMDILAVGKSLGAGSLALSVPNVNGKDTLVRVGGRNVDDITFVKVADGPIRAIFRMHHKNLLVANNLTPVNVTEEISIWGGKNYYQSRVKVTNAPEGAKLVTGIVNLNTKKSNELSIENCKVLYTYDVQSENKDHLGMGIIVQNKNFGSFGKTPNSGSEILNTYTVTLPLNTDPAEFRFFAGWERSDLLFTREENFKKYLQNESIKYGQPIVITWK